MSRLFALVRAVQADRLSPDQRSALERLVIALDVAVEIDAGPRTPWSAVAIAYRELADLDDGDGGSTAPVVPLRRTGGGR
ncbi:hypothetical protein GCM10023201_40660 [Actinomycetospora corticicola]|uniref:Uncharacterized protein n=1 Tax=Actinomycetospora corticicola TaxID=663602 RepID=A0A7Y9J660_9PSEU|nr:hypothetical protein [Actinomycetospora corticicola]NYD36850.1 hypothetical protein [Actinomycetospora corticicola]